MRRTDIKWDCSTHGRPTNAYCEECGRVATGLRDAFPAMRAIKMRALAAEILLGFAASQYGNAIMGDYGLTPEAEIEARRTLHVAARAFVETTPPRRRR